MSSLKSAAIIIVALGLTGAAYSDEKKADEKKADGKKDEKSLVTISSPTEGQKLPNNSTKLVYEVAPGSKGEHVHIFIDGDEVARIHEMKGSYSVDKLTTGKHWLCVRVVDKAHTPVGQEKCVGVVAGNIPPMGY